MNQLKAEALRYAEGGMSVIPVRPDKKPYLRWQRYQKQRASLQQIEQWWRRWPDAGIGLVTGLISGLVVIDVDSLEGEQSLQDLLPESLVTPVASTPRGGRHYYFRHPEEGPLSNNTGAIPGVDFRADGGYIVAPPSSNGQGKGWRWLKDLSIWDVPFAGAPRAYLDHLKNVTRSNHLSPKVTNLSPNVTISLDQGHRDNTLFHIANCLLKGGMPGSEAEAVLGQLALSCTPPYPLADIPYKISSVLKRINIKERNIASEIRQWVLDAPGIFDVSQLDRELSLLTPVLKNNRKQVFNRLCQERIIERAGDKRGYYRLIESSCEVIDFKNASDHCIPLAWPFGIERYFRAMPKNIIVVAGEIDAGKTAFVLNFIRMNMAGRRIHYFSSEMGAAELRDRLGNFGLPLEAWSFHARERSGNFADVMQPDDINIVDYLEMSEDFYKVGGHIRAMFDRLRGGIALIALQKNQGVDWGLGGQRSLEKARLYLAMEPGRLKIIKCKNWATPTFNPNRLQITFKLARGCRFIETSAWHKQEAPKDE